MLDRIKSASDAELNRLMARIQAEIERREYEADSHERVPCPDYCNDGIIITCCDDLCQEHCIHGDGEEACPTCKGEGWVIGKPEMPQKGE